MRSSLLLAAAALLVVGTVARPHGNKPHTRKFHKAQRINVVTEIAVEVVTIVVTVTDGYDQATSTSSAFSTTAPKPDPKPTEVYAPPSAPPSSTSGPSPTPTPTPAPRPQSEPSFEVSSSPKPSPKPQQPEPKPSSSYTPPAASEATPAAQPTKPSGDHPSGANQAYLSSGLDYQAAVLYHHNAARANHDAAPLIWDSDCEANARITAQKCTFAHYIPEGAGQGQNLFTVSGDAFNVTAGITDSWYKGELPPMMPYFGRNEIPGNVFHSVGHLTQMVWKATTKVGCVSVDCGSNMIVGGSTSSMNKYTVCNYAPAGNYAGAYAKNVAAPISMTNLGGWAD